MESAKALEQAKRQIARGAPLMRPTKARTLYEQLLAGMERLQRGGGATPGAPEPTLDVSPLHTSGGGYDERAFSVEFQGEGATDAGGPCAVIAACL